MLSLDGYGPMLQASTWCWRRRSRVAPFRRVPASRGLLGRPDTLVSESGCHRGARSDGAPAGAAIRIHPVLLKSEAPSKQLGYPLRVRGLELGDPDQIRTANRREMKLAIVLPNESSGTPLGRGRVRSPRSSGLLAAHKWIGGSLPAATGATMWNCFLANPTLPGLGPKHREACFQENLA